jgi:hypothetical protein
LSQLHRPFVLFVSVSYLNINDNFKRFRDCVCIFTTCFVSLFFYQILATTVKPNQPAQTRATPSTNPVTSPFRPSNIEQWGREGERFQAGTVQAQPGPAIGPAPQQQPSPFQHQNPAIQVPPFPVQQQQQLGPR